MQQTFLVYSLITVTGAPRVLEAEDVAFILNQRFEPSVGGVFEAVVQSVRPLGEETPCN